MQVDEKESRSKLYIDSIDHTKVAKFLATVHCTDILQFIECTYLVVASLYVLFVCIFLISKCLLCSLLHAKFESCCAVVVLYS